MRKKTDEPLAAQRAKNEAIAARVAVTEAAAAATEAAAAASKAAFAAESMSGAMAAAKGLTFPYTSRSHPSWFEDEPEPSLIEQCLRPGHCALEGQDRDTLYARLGQLGHAFNEQRNPLMALTCFECSFSARRGATELMSSFNMRLKLGQAGLVEELYKRILCTDLNPEERKTAQRKLNEVIAINASRVASLPTPRPTGSTASPADGPPSSVDPLSRRSGRASGGAPPAAPASSTNHVSPALPTPAVLPQSHTALVVGTPPAVNALPEDLSTDVELAALLSAPHVAKDALIPARREWMLPQLRSCATAANLVGDYEAAIRWFDCAYALSSSPSDLIAGCNMRVQLDPASPLAFAAHEHAIRNASDVGSASADGDALPEHTIFTVSSDVVARLEARLVASAAQQEQFVAQQAQLQDAFDQQKADSADLRAELRSLRGALVHPTVGEGEDQSSMDEKPSLEERLRSSWTQLAQQQEALRAQQLDLLAAYEKQGTAMQALATRVASAQDPSPPRADQLAGAMTPLDASAPPRRLLSTVGLSPSDAMPLISATGNERRLHEASERAPPAFATPETRASRVSIKDPVALSWALVEGDTDVVTALKDVRGRIHDYVEKTGKKQPKIADLEGEGTLFVQLLRARNLLAADTNGLSDPYAKISLGEHKQRSRKIRRTLNPVWDNEVFAFTGVLGQLIAEPLKLTMWDFDLASKDDQLGHVEIELADHTYCEQVRRDIGAALDTQGDVMLQVWWEPEGLSDDEGQRVNRRHGRNSSALKVRWYVRVGEQLVRPVPRRLRTFKGCCAACCIKVLHPDSKFRSGWNILLAVLILYCGIAVPLEIAFESDMVQVMCTAANDPHGPQSLLAECGPYQTWFWMNFLVDLWFMADIYLNFRTGYVQEGHFVSDDWLVAKAYLKGSFILDVLGTFPLNIVTMMANPGNPYGDPQVAAMQASTTAGGGVDPGRANRMLRLMRMAKLTKLARMRKLAKYIESFEEFVNPGVLAVLKLVFISLFCCHLFGSLWWMISDLEMSEQEAGSTDPWFITPWYAGENNWHPPRWLKHEGALSMKYMHSLYWGAGMVTSLVPRDIEPVTSLEALITTTTMFFGLLLNAFVISSLNQALAAMNSKKELTGKQLESIKSFLIIKSIPPSLRSRIMEYYQYSLSSSAALDGLNLFENLPPALSAQLNLSCNRRLASHCPFFRDVSNAALVSLIADFRAVVYIPSQFISAQGSPLAAAFFINRGIVKVSTHDGTTSTLTNNDNFGLDDYYAGSIANSEPQVSKTTVAVTYCDLMSVAVEDLDKALTHDPSFCDAISEARRRAKAAHIAASHARRRSLSPAQLSESLMPTKSSVWGKSLKAWPTLRNKGGANSSKDAGRNSGVTACLRLARKLTADQALVSEEPSLTASMQSCAASSIDSNSPSNNSSSGEGQSSRRSTRGPKLRAAIIRAARRIEAGEIPYPIDSPDKSSEGGDRRQDVTPSVAADIRGFGSGGSSGSGSSNGSRPALPRLNVQSPSIVPTTRCDASSRTPSSRQNTGTSRNRDDDYREDAAASARDSVNTDANACNSARSRPGRLSSRERLAARGKRVSRGEEWAREQMQARAPIPDLGFIQEA